MHSRIVTSDDLKAMSMNITVLLDLRPCSLVEGHQRYGETYGLHFLFFILHRLVTAYPNFFFIIISIIYYDYLLRLFLSVFPFSLLIVSLLSAGSSNYYL